MVDLRGLTAKAKQFARRNPDKVDKVLNGAGNFVDRRTGRKYERHVDTVQQKARQFLGGDRTTGESATGEQPVGRPGDQGASERPGAGPEHGDRPGAAPEHGDRPGGAAGTGRPDQDPRP